MPAVATRRSRTNSPTCSVKVELTESSRVKMVDEQRDLHHVGERIGDEHPVEDAGGAAGGDDPRDGCEAADGRECGRDGEPHAGGGLLEEKQVDGHDEERRGDDDDLRHGEMQELGVDRVHCQLPVRMPLNSGPFKAGTMMLRSTCG